MAGRRPVPKWLLVFLLLNVAEDCSIGISGLGFGTRILVPLHGLTPLNARFIAALYTAGAVGVGLTLLARNVVDIRIVLIAFEAITLLVLVMTFVYRHDFTANGTPIGWLFTYTVDPIVGAFAIVRLGLQRPAAPGRHALSALFALGAVFFGVLGVALVTDPSWVAHGWPWGITPLLGRVYASFFLAFAVGCTLAVGERRSAALLPFTVAALTLFVGSAAVSLYHHSRFHASAQTTAWVVVHVVGVVAFTAALAVLARPAPELIPRPST
jgi:hypothetical protein